MLYLLGAVACSVTVASILKLVKQHRLNVLTVITCNYVAATLVGIARLGSDVAIWGRVVQEPRLVLLGVATGALFIGGIFVYARAVAAVGIALGATVMRLAFILPVLASWLLYGETPTAGELVAVVLGGVALSLLTQPADQSASTTTRLGGDAFGWLLALFFVGGLAHVAMKTFDVFYGATYPRPVYTTLLFGVALSIGLGTLVRQGLRTRQGPHRTDMLWGFALGLANYGAVELLLQAISTMRGPLVFPLNNVGIVLGATTLGVLVWRERLGRANVAGLVLALLALGIGLLWV